MGVKKDLTGQRFGRLTVLRENPVRRYDKVLWHCRCDCGKEVDVVSAKLVSGWTKSCGCYHVQRASECNKGKDMHGRKNPNYRHGHRRDRIYTIWTDMKARCSNENCPDYHLYGGRGIIICAEWQDNFMAFYDWAIANGYRDDLSIDRINNNGNYEPSNCRWTTPKVQAQNRRISKSPGSSVAVVCVDTMEVFGSVKEAAKCKGVHETAISACIHGKLKTAGGYHWAKKDSK